MEGRKMRYYRIRLPDSTQDAISSNVRSLRNLPEGTRVFCVLTERDGSLMDEWELPVKAGKVVFTKKGIHGVRPSKWS